MNFSDELQYQFKPFIGSSHYWAIQQLSKIDPTAKVLDFGAGTGFVGAKLTDQGNKELYAVEIDSERCAKLQKIYKQAETTLDQLKIDKFDLICLLDILEHLTNPFEYLQELAQHSNSKGQIFISLPNITHWSIRLTILFGLFEYTNRGLLDKTHYSFFNKRRALKLANSLEDFDLKSYSVSVSPVEYLLPEAVKRSKPMKLFNIFRTKLANLFPNLLGYQHLLVLEKK